MNKLRIVTLLFVLSIACKPFAESKALEAQQPKQPAAQIPATVSAARRTPVVVVAHNTLPAVVNIQTEATIRRREADPFFDPFGFFGGRDRVYNSQSLGSGFVWSTDGIIVTNNHVVEGASRITVNFQDGAQLSAKLIGVDPDSDLAVLKVDTKKLLTAPIGTSADLMIGETVIAVGNPFGLSGSVTTGVVSALGRSVPSKEAGRTFTDFIQTDASINPGNSGGPLLDSRGFLLGMNTMIFSESGASQGIGFALPANTINRIVTQIIKNGRVIQPSLGFEPFDSSINRQLNLEGVIIRVVTDGGGAARAGLRGTHRTRNGDIILGDIIIGVEDKKIRSFDDLLNTLDSFQVGDSVKVTFIREGKKRTLPVQLGDMNAR